jgi:hypothetical protein
MAQTSAGRPQREQLSLFQPPAPSPSVLARRRRHTRIALPRVLQPGKNFRVDESSPSGNDDDKPAPQATPARAQVPYLSCSRPACTQSGPESCGLSNKAIGRRACGLWPQRVGQIRMARRGLLVAARQPNPSRAQHLTALPQSLRLESRGPICPQGSPKQSNLMITTTIATSVDSGATPDSDTHLNSNFFLAANVFLVFARARESDRSMQVQRNVSLHSVPDLETTI